MQDDRKIEDYRGHKLLAALHGGAFQGRVWKDSSLVVELDGSSLGDVLTQLKARVDASLSERGLARSTKPSVQEYLEAFRRILPRLTDGHLAMLRAHYKATDNCLTATQLAAAAGYSNYSAANLQYGLVGRALYEELPVDLPRRADGTLIYTCALATGPADEAIPEEQWVWRMLPEVLEAVGALGLHT